MPFNTFQFDTSEWEWKSIELSQGGHGYSGYENSDLSYWHHWSSSWTKILLSKRWWRRFFKLFGADWKPCWWYYGWMVIMDILPSRPKGSRFEDKVYFEFQQGRCTESILSLLRSGSIAKTKVKINLKIIIKQRKIIVVIIIRYVCFTRL